MQNIKQWEILPSNEPTVIRSCSKCGNNSTFSSTGNFRVNANRNNLDVWLIYQCSHCKTTWNMTILTRVKPDSIPYKLYQHFLCNDPNLALEYAFDLTLHSKNKSTLNYEALQFKLIGETIDIYTITEPVKVILSCKYPLGIRIGKLLGAFLCLSGEEVKRLCIDGVIVSDSNTLWKERLSKPFYITFYPSQVTNHF